ncbi:MAG: hypothetical protein CME60_05630 [Halobacteriovoraceae bacterium]|nr:hypothetical protein [Halobacteriovoraceae bacterium]|tara:strand:- start:1077 stop:2288 length:1212 start_codon:yes stop_codon:yes gene_type:complete
MLLVRLNLRARITFLILSSLLFCPISIHSKNLYSLADLEVLQKGKSYEEYFEHARDILPSKRNEYWIEMLSSMAIDYVDELRSQKQFNSKYYKKIYELGTWPELKRDEFFQIKRNSYALSYFKSCFTKKDKEICASQMKKYWKSARKDLETGYQMASLYYGFFPGPKAMPYLGQILHQEKDQFYCSKDITKRIFTDYILHENMQLMDPKKRKYFLDQKIGKSCWNKINPYLKEVLNQLNPIQGKSIFVALKLNEELTPIQYHEWMLRYFLQSPPPGEILNLSWNSLKDLSQNYALREKVLEKMKKRDPLPGKLFETLDHSRSQALTFHLQDSFPEYIRHYAVTCLNYLRGKGHFPYGNPTPECHELFRKSESGDKKLKSLLTDSWKKIYFNLLSPNKTALQQW